MHFPDKKQKKMLLCLIEELKFSTFGKLKLHIRKHFTLEKLRNRQEEKEGEIDREGQREQ